MVTYFLKATTNRGLKGARISILRSDRSVSSFLILPTRLPDFSRSAHLRSARYPNRIFTVIGRTPDRQYSPPHFDPVLLSLCTAKPSRSCARSTVLSLARFSSPLPHPNSLVHLYCTSTEGVIMPPDAPVGVQSEFSTAQCS